MSTMRVVEQWSGDVSGWAPLELVMRTSPHGAWEVELAERGGKKVIRWFHAEVEARAYAANVRGHGVWIGPSAPVAENTA